MRTTEAVLLLSALTLALICAWCVPRPRGAFYTRLLALTVVEWAVELTGAVTAHLGVRNVLLYDLYIAVEFTMLMDLVRLLRPGWTVVLRIALAIGLLTVAYGTWQNGWSGFAWEGIFTIGVLCSAVFLWLLVDLARTSTEPLWRLPVFWLFTGLLLYFSGIVPFIGAAKILHTLDRQQYRTMHLIVTALAMVRFVCTALSCHMERQRVLRTSP